MFIYSFNKYNNQGFGTSKNYLPGGIPKEIIKNHNLKIESYNLQ